MLSFILLSGDKFVGPIENGSEMKGKVVALHTCCVTNTSHVLQHKYPSLNKHCQSTHLNTDQVSTACLTNKTKTFAYLTLDTFINNRLYFLAGIVV